MFRSRPTTHDVSPPAPPAPYPACSPHPSPYPPCTPYPGYYPSPLPTQAYGYGPYFPTVTPVEMIFMPCFCKACRQLEDVKLWEQEHETDFTGPWPRPCPYQADISSKILPERPADLPPRAKHLFRRMMGSIKVIPHVSIPDNQLYAFISQLKPNANPTDREPYLQAAETLKNLCRSRNLTIRDSRSQGGSSSKRAMIKKLMEYLDKNKSLPEHAQWPQPAPDAAGPDGGNL